MLLVKRQSADLTYILEGVASYCRFTATVALAGRQNANALSYRNPVVCC